MTMLSPLLSLLGRLVIRVVAPSVIAIALAGSLAPVLFLGTTDVQQVKIEFDSPPERPLERLSDVALHRAGVTKLVQYDSSYNWERVENEIVTCSRDKLILAIAVAEMYQRSAWRRNFEIAAARLLYSLTGSYPDWSYGVGQIRLNTARDAIVKARSRLEPIIKNVGPIDISDGALFKILAEPCQNLAVLGLVVDDGARSEETVADITSRYRGGPELPLVPGVVSYASLVSEIYWGRMDPDYAESEGAKDYLQRKYSAEPQHVSVVPISPPADDVPKPIACFHGENNWFSGLSVVFAPYKAPDAGGPVDTITAKSVLGLLKILNRRTTKLMITLGVDSDELASLTQLARYGQLINHLNANGVGPEDWEGDQIELIRRKGEGQALDNINCDLLLTVNPDAGEFYDGVAEAITMKPGAINSEEE
jgi:hypothetical protein